MQHCFSSLGCPDFSLDQVLALARTRSIPVVELRALGGSVDLPTYFAVHYGKPAGLADHLQGETVRVVAIDTSLKLAGSTDEDWTRMTDAFLPWVEALGGVRLRVFDGGHSGSPEEIAEMAARLAWWKALKKSRGWHSELMVETHDCLFTAAAVLKLVTASPGAPILWDTHHTWKRGGEDPMATWKALAPHVVHIHMKDSVSRPSAKHPYSYVLPGIGEFPAQPIVKALKAEYKGVVSLEWEKLWHPYLGTMDEALASAAELKWW